MGTILPPNIKFTEADLNDLDLFAHGTMDYDYLEVIPTIEGQSLNLMFPKGSKGSLPKGKRAQKVFIRRWYWIWSKYEQIIASLMAKIKWKNLPKEIKPWYIENLVNKNGSCAIVLLEGIPIAINYEATKKNIYNEPITIKIIHTNEQYNNKEYQEGEFVIIWNQPSRQSTFMDTIQYIEGLYSALEGIRRNTNTSQPKVFFPKTATIEEGGVSHSVDVIMNEVIEGSQTFYSFTLSKTDIRNQQEIAKITPPKDLFYTIELTDRTEPLIKTAEYWNNQINERAGLDMGLAFEKKERLIGAEVETRNSAGNGVLEAKLLVRKQACEEMNKIFGWNVSIEEPENEAIEKSQEIQDKGNDQYVSSNKRFRIRKRA